MKKIKSFMAIMVAAVTLVLGMNSCSSDSGDSTKKWYIMGATYNYICIFYYI